MDYLTVREVAEIKECSERYIKRLCKDGKPTSIQTTSCKGRMKYMIPVSALSEQSRLYTISRNAQKLALFRRKLSARTLLEQR